MEGEEVKSGDASKSTENHRVFVVVMARGALPQAQLHGDNNLCCEGRGQTGAYTFWSESYK